MRLLVFGSTKQGCNMMTVLNLSEMSMTVISESYVIISFSFYAGKLKKLS